MLLVWMNNVLNAIIGIWHIIQLQQLFMQVHRKEGHFNSDAGF